jgi:lipopolysaccharide transport system permease protein
VRKIAFPKSILYGYIVLSSAINLLLALTIFMMAYLVTGHGLHLALLAWLPLIALQLAFGLGIGVLTSVVHVFLRDTAQLIGVAFQFLFWATPIVYVANVLPAWLAGIERFNPLFAFTTAHRTIVLDGAPPSLTRIAFLVAITAATLGASVVVYRRFRGEILDEL